MAKDIFNREVDLGAPLAADAVRMLINTNNTELGSRGGEDMMVQEVTLNYAQEMSRLWEVGSSKTYFIAGRTRGGMGIKRVVGGQGIMTQFVENYGNVCKMSQNQLGLMMDAKCDLGELVQGDRGMLFCSACVITTVNYAIASQNMIINEDLQLLFARLEKQAPANGA